MSKEHKIALHLWDYRIVQYAKYHAAACYSCLENCNRNFVTDGITDGQTRVKEYTPLFFEAGV
jgi:hypothetical protein